MPTWLRRVRMASSPDPHSMTSYRFAVLGDPVSHSRSPEIHGAMFAITGLQGTYERVRANKAILAETIDGLRVGDWDGLNITVPLKIDAAGLADHLSPRTRFSHSINTLFVQDGSVHGESTDSLTFEEILQAGPVSGNDEILLLGSGGSAAAALAAIGDRRRVRVSARDEVKARRLAEHFGTTVLAWGSNIPGALVINATTLGMRGEPLPGGILETAGGLIDLPYGESPTSAIELATELGLPFVDGPEFLMRQAMASFRIWTGESVDLDRLRETLKNG